jgi:antitoxin ParD1/3/4
MMRHEEFTIGGIFWCGGRQWRCTDIGTRVIVAMQFDLIEVESTRAELRRTLSQTEAEAEGWFNGPPYAVAEAVFDEDSIKDCSRAPELDTLELLADSIELQPDKAQARALRDTAAKGGLRFSAYLPSGLAEWVLDLVERGVFVDPSEAVFVILGEHRDLEPHTDLREEALRRACQASIDDPRPGITHEELIKKLEARVAARPVPAVWRGKR